MPTNLKIVTVKLPESYLARIPVQNRSEFIREAVAEKLSRTEVPNWRPKTALGQRLLELSDRYSGERLDAEGIAKEIRQRRGGLA